MVAPEKKLQDYKSGAAPGGKGPSSANQRKNRHAREVSKAKRLGRKMFHDENCGHFVDPGSSHSPRENQRKRQKTKSKPKQQSSQTSSATPSTQEDRNNPTSSPLPMSNNSTANFYARCGSFFHTTPSSSGGHSVASTVQYGSSFIHTTPSSSGGHSTASNA